MPLTRISIRTGKSPEYKKALLDGVHAALVEAFRIPQRDRHQVLQELDENHFETPQTKTGNVTVIEITAFQGRTAKAKKALYEAIVRSLSRAPGIGGDDILIIIHEPPLENWGIRGGKPASEVNLGFEVNV